MNTRLATYTDKDPYGRNSITGMKTFATERRLRRSGHGQRFFFHRTKNGVYDPLTYWHVLDTLLELHPDEFFRTVEFVAVLEDTRPQLVWDPTTVGRVLNDLAESLQEAEGEPVIKASRRWNGMIYMTPGKALLRGTMFALLDDLYKLCEALMEAEATGKPPKRLNSPMLLCPTVGGSA